MKGSEEKKNGLVTFLYQLSFMSFMSTLLLSSHLFLRLWLLSLCKTILRIPPPCCHVCVSHDKVSGMSKCAAQYFSDVPFSSFHVVDV